MTSLIAGEAAPDFNALDQFDNHVELHNYRGQKVALFFYPKDDTPGCSAEACNLLDNLDTLKESNIQVLGCSPDSLESHKAFTEKYEISYPLLVDEDKKIINAYGVWGKKTVNGQEYEGVNRTTFIIDENGVISHIITDVDTSNASQQILDLVSTNS